jgi:hypothetical protein
MSAKWLMRAWARTVQRRAAKLPVVVESPGAKKAPDGLARVLPALHNGWAADESAYPKPRDYRQDMPRKMRRAALRSALSVKAADNDIVVLEELVLPEPKTRLMAASSYRLVGDAKVLILIPEKNELRADHPFGQ